MAMPATITDWTVDMLDALPSYGQRYEIIDGELFVTPGPAEFHQDIAGELHALFREYLTRAKYSAKESRGNPRECRQRSCCTSTISSPARVPDLHDVG